MRVSPFGHLRIKAYVRLPGAFRSLSRPSSAPSAKASALRSSSLDQYVFRPFCFAVPRFFSLELSTVFPVCPPVFPGCLIFCYLNDNASIDVLPQLLTSAASYSSCAQASAFRLPLMLCKIIVYAVFKVRRDSMSLPFRPPTAEHFFLFWRPPALPCRLQHSTIGRAGLNRRVRDGNGCVPCTYRRQISESSPDNSTARHISLLLLP